MVQEDTGILYYWCSRIPQTEPILPPDSSFSNSRPSDPSTPHTQRVYSVECNGLENKLSDCAWSKSNDDDKLMKGAMVLCKDSELILRSADGHTCMTRYRD